MLQIPHNKILYTTVNVLIATVWFINGLFCKVLNFAPRHQEIVAYIVNKEYARELTLTIGILEIGMAIWVLSQIKPKYLVTFQISIILLMNCIEFTFVPQLLLWGKSNMLFAVLFCALIYVNDRYIKPRKAYGLA